jgi:hypothetical protein
MSKLKLTRNVLSALIGVLLAGQLNTLDRAVIHSPRLQSSSQIEYQLKQEQNPTKQDYALLINSNGAIEGSYVGSTDSINEAYRTLRERGYSDDQILILSPNVPRGRDLKRGVTARPTERNLKIIRDYLERNLSPESTTTVVYEGHHATNRKGNKVLLGNDRIQGEQFAQYFSTLPGNKIYMLNTCHAEELSKQLNRGEGNRLVLGSSRTGNRSLGTVGQRAWQRISQGEDIKTAYKNAISQDQKRVSRRIARATRLARNDYVGYSKGDVELPRYENQEQPLQEKGGLEQKVLNILLIFGGFLSLLFFSPITGNVIKEQQSSNTNWLIPLTLVFSIIGIFFIIKLKSK